MILCYSIYTTSDSIPTKCLFCLAPNPRWVTAPNWHQICCTNQAGVAPIHQFTDSPPDRFDSNWLPTICSWHQSHLRTRDEKIYQNYVIKAKTNNGSIIFREQYKPFCKRSEFEGMLRIVWRTTRTCLWAGLGGWNGRRRRRGSVGCVWGGCGHRKRCIMSRRDIPYPWPLLFVQDVTAIYICDPQQTDQ